MPFIAGLNKRHAWALDLLGLALVIGLFYFLFSGVYPLFTPDEGRYSEVAREMVATGDYITPRVNGVAFLDKPILYYWLQAAAIHLFGVNEWALRFFPALFGLFGCLLTYAGGRRLFDRRTGLLSAIILAATPLYFGCAHYANLDLEVAVLISGSLLSFITALTFTGRSRNLLLFIAYLFAGLAILTKGLIGIVFPGMIISTWIILTRRWRLFLDIHLISGLLLIMAINLPWYVLAEQATPGFFHYFFVTQHFTRYLSAADFNNKMPFWFYLPVIFIGLMPWSLLTIPAISQTLRSLWHQYRNHQNELYLLVWALLVFLFFSIPHSKLISYILPVLPPLALLTGRFIAGYWAAKKAIRLTFILLTIMNVMGLSALLLYASHLNTNSIKPLAIHLKKIVKAEDEVAVYFRYFQDAPLYLERRVTIAANWQAKNIALKDNWQREFWNGMPFQDTANWLIDEDAFWQRWQSDKRMYVFVSDNYLDQFKVRAGRYYLIKQYRNVMLLSNHRPPDFSET